MEIRVQSIHFDASEQLQSFIEKKVNKLSKHFDDIRSAEITLKVVKPESALNKEANLRVIVPNEELFAAKTCDTFEESVDECVEAIVRQLKKYKEKLRGK